jgi:hypothetical protein
MQTGIIISSSLGFSILAGIYVNKLRGNNCVIHTTWYTVCTDKEYNTKVVYSLLYHVTGPLYLYSRLLYCTHILSYT